MDSKYLHTISSQSFLRIVIRFHLFSLLDHFQKILDLSRYVLGELGGLRYDGSDVFAKKHVMSCVLHSSYVGCYPFEGNLSPFHF